MNKFTITPISLKDANAFVLNHHRHHKASRGHKFSIGLKNDESIVGVVIVGRPVARLLDDGMTLEVVRLCVTVAENSCSLLYGAARRAAKALGYKKIITYTLPEEGGASLRGAGWKNCGLCGGGTWTRKNRPRDDKHPLDKKFRWEAT